MSSLHNTHATHMLSPICEKRDDKLNRSAAISPASQSMSRQIFSLKMGMNEQKWVHL